MGLKALIYYAAYVIPAIFGSATFAVLTHLISPTDYATYSTSFNLSYFAGSALFAWIVFSTARFEAEAKGPVATGFWLKCFAAMIPVAFVVLVSVSLLGFAPLFTVMAILALSTSQSFFNLMQEFLRSRNRSQAFLGFNLTRSIIGVSTVIPLAYYFQDGHLLLVGTAISFLIAALLNLAMRAASADVSPKRAYQVKPVVLYGAGVAASGLVFASIGVITRLMVLKISGIDSAGPYNAAIDLAGQIGGLVAMSVASAIAPTIIKSYADGDSGRVTENFQRGAELLLAAVAPTAVGLMLVATPFAEVLTGPAFRQNVAMLLPWLVASVAIWNINHYYVHLAFQVVSKPFLQVIAGSVQVVLLIALSYPLIHRYGPLGAAQGMLLANLVTLIVTVALARRVFPIPFPVVAAAKVAACTLIMALVVLTVAPLFAAPLARLSIQVLAGAVAYASAALAINLCGSRDAMTNFLRASTR